MRLLFILTALIPSIVINARGDHAQVRDDLDNQCKAAASGVVWAPSMLQASTKHEEVMGGVADMPQRSFERMPWVIILVIAAVLAFFGGLAMVIRAIVAPMLASETGPPWAAHYHSIPLLKRCMALCGKQIGPLIIAYYSISKWNPQHHELTMRCTEYDSPLYRLPCEGTKGFARNFPLIASVVTLVVAVRFIIQTRVHYRFLQQGALLNFDNYEVAQIMRDPAVLYMLLSFTLGVSHFLFDFLTPPYDLDYILLKCKHVGPFMLPCIVFFFVFREGCRIEFHLVTLARFYEHDYQAAKKHLENTKMYSEKEIRSSTHQVLKREAEDVQSTTIEVTINKIIEETKATTGFVEDPEPSRTSLFTALWPGRLLLSKHMEDRGSKAFKTSFRWFFVAFSLWCTIIMAILVSEAVADANDIHAIAAGAEFILGAPFEIMGYGYCRDEKFQPPPFFYQAWDKIEPLAASNISFWQSTNLGLLHVPVFRESSLSFVPGMQSFNQTSWLGMSRTSTGNFVPTEEQKQLCYAYCNATRVCSGMAVGKDFCTIYVSKKPREFIYKWKESDDEDYDDRSSGRQTDIVQVSKYATAICYRKVSPRGQWEDWPSFLVTVLNLVIVPGIWVNTYLRLRFDKLKLFGFDIWSH